MEHIETVVIITTKKGRSYRFSFDGDFSIEEYINKQSLKIGGVTFLKVRNIYKDFSEADVSLVNISSVELIKIEHEFPETN